MIRPILTSKWFYGALAGVAAWVALTMFSVMGWAEAGLLVALVFVVAYVGTRTANMHNVSWETPVVRHTRQGARDDIMHLSWLLFGRSREVTYGGMKHVRETVETVFGPLGIDQHTDDHSRYLRTALGSKIADAILGDNPELNLTDRELNKLLRFLNEIVAKDNASLAAEIAGTASSSALPETPTDSAKTPSSHNESEVAS